jgi:hypothetical protein
MNVAEVLTALTAHDADVVLEGDRVRVVHPAGNPPPPELIAIARRHRNALRAILEDRKAKAAPTIYAATIAALCARCPERVEHDRWQQVVRDADTFIPPWGEQAHALGWSSGDLFGLHRVPDAPARTYSRLGRYDATGLIWILQGRPVVMLTDAAAVIENPSGTVTVYRKYRKPSFDPVGDTLDNFR